MTAIAKGRKDDIHGTTPSDPSGGSPRIVLTPKLRPPLQRPEQLVRPGLQSLLRLTSDCKLTLVSAPAGYGKTTLLTQWREAEKANLSFAWVSLDEQDNNPQALEAHCRRLRRVSPQGAPREASGRFSWGMNARVQRLSESRFCP